MLRESHTQPCIRIATAIALITGLALVQPLTAKRAEAFGLGLKKQPKLDQSQSQGQQPEAPAFDPTASPLEPEEAAKEANPEMTGQETPPSQRPQESTPESTREPTLKTTPEPTNTQAQPESSSRPETEPEPKPETEAEPKPEPKPEPKIEPKLPTTIKIKNLTPAKEGNTGTSEAFLELAPPLNLETSKESIFIYPPVPKQAVQPTKQEAWPEFKDNAEAKIVRPAPGEAAEDGNNVSRDDANNDDKPVTAKKGISIKIDPTKQIHRQDISRRFGYVLPDGWRTYQIPYQAHDVLTLRNKDRLIATISFSDQLRKGNLEKLKAMAIENAKESISKYELLSADVTTLASGLPCVRILGQGQLDDVAARQLQYVVPLSKKYPLVVTLTVGKIMGDKYDKLMHDVVESLTTDAVVTKLRQIE